MYFEQYKYSIAAHFLPALINGDYSGLSDCEQQALEEFEAGVCWEVATGCWTVDTACSSYFTRDAVSKHQASCYTCIYNVPVID